MRELGKSVCGSRVVEKSLHPKSPIRTLDAVKRRARNVPTLRCADFGLGPRRQHARSALAVDTKTQTRVSPGALRQGTRSQQCSNPTARQTDNSPGNGDVPRICELRPSLGVTPRRAMNVSHGEAATEAEGLKANQSARDCHIRYPLVVEQLKSSGCDRRHRNRWRQTLRTFKSKADAAYTAGSLPHGWPHRAMI
jgi:hypothetical protein